MKHYLYGGLFLALLLSHYWMYNTGQKIERISFQQAVIDQHEKDSEIALKLEKENVLLKKTTKKLAKSLRESSDSSNCSRTSYPGDRHKRLLNALRSIEQN